MSNVLKTGEFSSAPRGFSTATIEVGHEYLSQLAAMDKKSLVRRFAYYGRQADVYSRVFKERLAEETPEGKYTESRCHLIDDYNGSHYDPNEILSLAISGLREANTGVQYLVREAGAVANAEHVFKRIRENVPRHPESRDAELWVRSMGLAPRDGTGEVEYVFGPTMTTGESSMAMHPNTATQDEYRTRFETHAELFRTRRKRGDSLTLSDGRVLMGSWACCLLATTFQAERLGLELAVPPPQPVLVDPDKLPYYDSWRDVPTTLQLDPNASPLQGRQSLSILPTRDTATEHMVSQYLELLDPSTTLRRSLILVDPVEKWGK